MRRCIWEAQPWSRHRRSRVASPIHVPCFGRSQHGRRSYYCGRAWVFGDNIGIDSDLMAFEWALNCETRPDGLREHVFAQYDPDFRHRARLDDVVVAGWRFAQGNPHIQGIIGLRGCAVGVLAETIPIASFRNALAAGLPCFRAVRTCAPCSRTATASKRLRHWPRA